MWKPDFDRNAVQHPAVSIDNFTSTLPENWHKNLTYWHLNLSGSQNLLIQVEIVLCPQLAIRAHCCTDILTSVILHDQSRLVLNFGFTCDLKSIPRVTFASVLTGLWPRMHFAQFQHSTHKTSISTCICTSTHALAEYDTSNWSSAPTLPSKAKSSQSYYNES